MQEHNDPSIALYINVKYSENQHNYLLFTTNSQFFCKMRSGTEPKESYYGQS